jgi:flap endonuclease-1
VKAPSEGEAQAAYMAKKGDCYACVSQDFDSLLHGAPYLVRNLSIIGRKKTTNKLAYEVVKPTMLNLAENLNHLGIDQDQLIVLALLVGTDYNVGGVRGLGPKKALSLVKKFGSNFDGLFKQVDWHFKFEWTEAFYIVKKMPVVDKYDLNMGEIDNKKVINLLVDKHDFSMERVKSTLSKLSSGMEIRKQKGLSDFIK